MCGWFTGTGTAAKYAMCFLETGQCSISSTYEIEDAVAKQAKNRSIRHVHSSQTECVREKQTNSNSKASRRKVKVRRR